MPIEIIAAALAGAALVAAAVAWGLDVRNRPSDYHLPPAQPGSWFGRYHDDWDRAHPGAWENGTGKSGCFFKDDVWGSSTLEWDREWFNRNGRSLPRKTTVVDNRAKPGEYRIGTLGPGESRSIPFQIGGAE